MHRALIAVAAVPLLLQAGCIDQLDRCAGREVRAGDYFTCPMPGWTDRGFDVFVPPGWDGVSPLPVVLAIHGGGGKKSAARRGTCAGADESSPTCLTAMAGALGVAVVYPDGTGRPFTNTRTWNAGGGMGDFQCVSGPACNAGIDDVRYFDELLDELGRIIPVDERRVYATGLSNGGAMSHRLACQLSGRIAAIAPVGGGNQWAETGGACDVQVPVLQIHGSDDLCWRYEQSPLKCGPLGDEGIHVGVPETLDGWLARNGCNGANILDLLPDNDPLDGTTTERTRWTNCAADVVHLRVIGGGHTWPGGDGLLSSDIVGVTARDFSANEEILEFFLDHPRP